MTPSLMVFEYHPPTISIISILITNLLCLLPTTLNHNLPETFEEAAAIQDKVNMFIEQRRKRSSKAWFKISRTLNPNVTDPRGQGTQMVSVAYLKVLNP